MLAFQSSKVGASLLWVIHQVGSPGIKISCIQSSQVLLGISEMLKVTCFQFHHSINVLGDQMPSVWSSMHIHVQMYLQLCFLYTVNVDSPNLGKLLLCSCLASTVVWWVIRHRKFSMEQLKVMNMDKSRTLGTKPWHICKKYKTCASYLPIHPLQPGTPYGNSFPTSNRERRGEGVSVMKL